MQQHQQAPARNAQGMIVFEEHCSAEDLPAVEAIIEFLYNEKLPKDPELIVLMLIKADYWGLSRCEDVCFAALSVTASRRHNQKLLWTPELNAMLLYRLSCQMGTCS